MPLGDRQQPVFKAFCDYLDTHDISSATHRVSVWDDFKQNAPSEVKDNFIFVRDHSDILYKYRDVLKERYPQFMALRSYPPKIHRQSNRVDAGGRSSIHVDEEIYDSFKDFLLAYDWRKPVRRALLRREFQATLTGDLLKRVTSTSSFWKNFEVKFADKLSLECPQFGHLRNLRVPHIVDANGLVACIGARGRRQPYREEAQQREERFRKGERRPQGRPRKVVEAGDGEQGREARPRGRPRKVVDVAESVQGKPPSRPRGWPRKAVDGTEGVKEA